MSRSSVDDLFGRALTSRNLRARLLADGGDVLDGYDLTSDERREALAWTDGTFEKVIGTLEAGVGRARFDGVGFETAADQGPPTPPGSVRVPAPALDRFIASVLPQLAARGASPVAFDGRSPHLGATPDLHHALLPDAPAAGSIKTREAHLRHAGIVRHVGESIVHWGDTRLYGCSVLYGGPYGQGRYVLPNVCGGRGRTAEDARVRALSEAAERFAGAVWDERELVFGSYRHLAPDAVPPAAFALFSGAQYAAPGFPYALFTEDTRVNWAWGQSLLSRKRRLVPAAFVYRPYWPGGHEARLADLPTTGLACGRSLEEAALHGLYEAVERDAIAIVWGNRLAVPRVRADASAWAASPPLSPDRRLSIHDITTDLGIPTLLALVVDRAESIVAVGAAARMDPREAASAAAAEALMLEPAVRAGRSRRAPGSPGVGEEVRTIDDHMLFHCTPERLGGLDFLLDAPVEATARERTPIGKEPGDELAAVLEALQRRSLDAIVVDVTLPEIAAAGLRVVRAIVPGLIPLTFGERFAARGGERLHQVPVALGYRTSPLREDQLNRSPHPFA